MSKSLAKTALATAIVLAGNNEPETKRWDHSFSDGAMFKHRNMVQGIYLDPGRDVIGAYFSTNGYISPYGEDKMAGFIRRVAKMPAGK